MACAGTLDTAERWWPPITSGDGPTHDYWLLDFGWGGNP